MITTRYPIRGNDRTTMQVRVSTSGVRGGSGIRRMASSYTGVYQSRPECGVGEVTARVEAALRRMITSGQLKPGDRLPSERSLVADLHASRSTVRLVLVRLVAEGLVRAEHGRAYFVCKPRS